MRLLRIWLHLRPPAFGSPARSALAELAPEVIDVSALRWSLRAPARNPLVRLVAHVLIRLLVVSALPAEVQVRAALLPISILWPVVMAAETKTTHVSESFAHSPLPQTPSPEPHVAGEGGSGHGARSRPERALAFSLRSAGAALSGDELSRVTSVTNPLGSFGYGYDGLTSRLKTVTYPTGLTRTYNYFPEAQDHRLQEIRNEKPGGVNVSRFGYTQDAENNIKTWTQTADASPTKAYDLGYDAADQLTSATLKDASSGALLKRYGYGYDKAGNRTAEQIDDASTAAVPNSVNELVSLQPGGALIFRGTTSEAATVTVQAKPAATTVDNKFEGQAPVGQGSTTVAVTATDPSGNTKTQNYQVSLTGATRTLSYDPNGNLTADGIRTYEWDALDRLTAVNEGTKRSELTYDGFSRRTRIVEKLSGATTSDKRLMWVGRGIAEERDAGGGTTTKRYFGQGVQQGSTSLYYAKDHLGSVRELIDTAGAVRARYDYDPYGRRTKTAGDLDADFGYTGIYQHGTSGLALTLYRTYDPGVGRWLSRDPIGLAGGLNLYAYVGNNPINYHDRQGLFGPFALAVAIVAAIAGLLLAPDVLEPPPGQTSDRTGSMMGAVAAVAGIAFACRLPQWGAGPPAGAPQGPPTSVDEAIDRGLFKPGGKLEDVLRALERGYEQDVPQTTQEGLEVVAAAVDQVAGMEPGIGEAMPGGGYVLQNVGGVTTTIDPSGNITVTRGAATLLCKRR